MPLDLTQFRRTLAYRVTAPYNRILTDLHEIADLDRFAEAKENYFKKIQVYWCWGLLVGVILLFAGAFLSDINRSLSGFTLLLSGLLLVSAIVALIVLEILKAPYKRLNVANSRYQLLQKVLLMLNRDMAPQANLTTTLLLSAATDKQKKVQTKPHPQRSGFKIDVFADPWLTLEGNFLDRSHFRFSLTEFNHQVYGWKRNARGKNKYKSKIKFKGMEIDLVLDFPLKRYGAIQVLQQDAESAVQLQHGQLKKLKLKENQIHLNAEVNAALGVEELYQLLMSMLLSLYHILNLAKVLSKNSV